MEDIIELILDLLLDGVFEMFQNKMHPKWIRIITLIVVILLYLAVAALLFWISMQVTYFIVKCLIAAVAILIIAKLARDLYKIIKAF